MEIAVPVVQGLLDRHDLSGRVRQLQTHRNALDSALLRLPNEILLSIVDLLVSDSFIGRGETTGWLAFMNTCMRARSLVLDTPRLWARIDLTQNVDWVRLCVHRARTFPLSISFDDTSLPAVGRGDSGSEDSDEEARILASFRTVANLAFPRARQAEIRIIRRHGFNHILYDMLHSYLPRLCSLEYTASVWGVERTQFCRLFASAPALTSLCLAYMEISVVDLCLPALVRLELLVVIIYEDPGVMFRFLKKSPLLRELELNTIHVQNPPNICVEPICLPHLRSLTLHAFDSASIPYLRAFPEPSDCLDLQVGGRDLEGTRIHEIRDYIWGPVDVERPIAVEVHVIDHIREGKIRVHMDHPGLRIGQVSFRWGTSLHNLHAALARAETIGIDIVEARYPPEFFERAAQDPHHYLAGVHKVVLRQACDAHAHHAFRTWLRARVDVGRRVTTVDLRGCQERRSGCLWKEEGESLRQMAQELRREGLVDEVLVEGSRAG
jgi:hypothetical protein